MWNGRLPKRAELDELRQKLAASYELPELISVLIKGCPVDDEPMAMLRTAVSALAFFDKEARDLSREASIRVATRLTARFPTIVAAIDRARNDLDPIEPNPDLNIGLIPLDLSRGGAPFLFHGRASVNQQNVSNTLVNFFNATGSIPAAFAGLNAEGLSTASGELGTGVIQSSIKANDLFLNLLLDRSVAGRVGGFAAAGRQFVRIRR